MDCHSKTYNLDEIPYEFHLLIRGSQSGFDRDAFWRFCDGCSNTVVVMRIRGSDEIIGGYNPLEWKSKKNSYLYTNNSFVFSLKNGEQNSIISRLRNGQASRAIYSSRAYGPRFARQDIFMENNFNSKNCKCICESYEVPIRNTSEKFSVDEYEVFKVYKKFDVCSPTVYRPVVG
ncbi:13423_t:CDS:1 [Acaulospora morrowiae]|uniref:13423_t:CDS:1 n=1 Tax=Acaulospora morrowiae TaxID=94023 RepID=A0A9N9AKQ8_9GLOM|nr:13423_t:CDS:1 [Acaulospora morrowiae]